jgi:hypothetical protein
MMIWWPSGGYKLILQILLRRHIVFDHIGHTTVPNCYFLIIIFWTGNGPKEPRRVALVHITTKTPTNWEITAWYWNFTIGHRNNILKHSRAFCLTAEIQSWNSPPANLFIAADKTTSDEDGVDRRRWTIEEGPPHTPPWNRRMPHVGTQDRWYAENHMVV